MNENLIKDTKTLKAVDLQLFKFLISYLNVKNRKKLILKTRKMK